MDNMTELLLGGLVAALWGLIQLYRKYLILRHLFIEYSDWCARKIDEMTESTVFEIGELAQELVRAAGNGPLTADEARDHVPCVVLEAKAEWHKEVRKFQALLARNGMRQLGLVDLDAPFLHPGILGMK